MSMKKWQRWQWRHVESEEWKIGEIYSACKSSRVHRKKIIIKKESNNKIKCQSSVYYHNSQAILNADSDKLLLSEKALI